MNGMDFYYLGLALFLLATVAAGLIRIVRGPTPADRMLAAQLFGTTTVAIFLLLSQALGERSLNDLALILALVAAVAGVAFVRRVWHPPEQAGSRGVEKE